MVIQHNMASIFTGNRLNRTTQAVSKSTERLSSGYRINRAADDAAGLSISEKMRWQIKGLDKGAQNVQDGVSLVQTAEGALSEVHEILERIKELSVQAANDTNTLQDRQAIQREINQLMAEIDRVGDTTEFNTKPLFKGEEIRTVKNASGEEVPIGSVPFKDFQLSDASLNQNPFSGAQGNANMMNLAVSLDPSEYTTANPAVQVRWPLLFSNNSYPDNLFSFQYNDSNGNTHSKEVRFSQMSVGNITNNGSGTYSRDITFQSDGINFNINQSIKVTDTDDEKKYQISFATSYQDPLNKTNGSINASLVYETDTGFGGSDNYEKYCKSKALYDKYTYFTNNPQDLGSGRAGVKPLSELPGGSLSIFSTSSSAPPFSEKVTVDPSNLESVYLGHYRKYPSTGIPNDTGSSMSDTTTDKAIYTTWSKNGLQPGASMNGSMEFSILKDNPDVPPMPIQNDPSYHSDKMSLWIQGGHTEGNGWFITVDEMNSRTLGVNRLDVTSFEKASEANALADAAIEKVSAQRASLGAQQNRLEHNYAIDLNTSENTQAAESRLRDTDLAKEMMQFSMQNILSQAGQSMLTEANQSIQNVMALLQ